MMYLIVYSMSYQFQFQDQIMFRIGFPDSHNPIPRFEHNF